MRGADSEGGADAGGLAGRGRSGRLVGSRLPGGFIPLEDTGYFLMNVQLPPAASLQRTDAVMQKIDALLAKTPGIQYYTTVSGYGVLSQTFTTYNAVVFVALKPWAERTTREERYKSILLSVNDELRKMPKAVGFAFPPLAIPGVGTTGAVTFLLEDRGGQSFWVFAARTATFLEAAAKRPEMARIVTTLIPAPRNGLPTSIAVRRSRWAWRWTIYIKPFKRSWEDPSSTTSIDSGGFGKST